jgi:type I restriction enzyme S subunit
VSDLPDGWIWATIGSIAESLVDGPFGSNLKTAHYQSSGVRVIRLQNIADGKFNDTNKAYISEERAQTLNRHDARPGDVLIAAMGDVLPRVCLVPHDVDWAIVKADCFRLRPREGVLPQYLSYMLSAPQTRKRASTQIAGVGRPRLNLKKVSGLTIPIPPERDQERIVAAIDEQYSRLDAGNSSLQRVQRNLTRARAAILDAAVGGKLLGANKDSWDELTLGELLDDIHAGKSFKCEERPSSLHEWGVVKVSAMTWGRFRESENKIVVDHQRVDPRFEINPGDLLVSRANTVEYVGAAVLVGKCRSRLLLSDKSLRLVPNSKALPEWLLISLRTSWARRYIESAATGTSDSMRNISQPSLKALRITLPPIDVQSRLVGEVDRLMSQIERLEESLGHNRRSAQALRSSILSAAFSGELT